MSPATIGDAEDVLKGADQGVSFYEFVRFILSPSQQESLQALIQELDHISDLAEQAGLDLLPYRALTAWLDRVQRQPRYIEDVEPYGANAAPGAGRSLYD